MPNPRNVPSDIIPDDLPSDPVEAYLRGKADARRESARRAGSAKSAAKSAAVRHNGLAGGAPRKTDGTPQEQHRREQLAEAKRRSRARAKGLAEEPPKPAPKR